MLNEQNKREGDRRKKGRRKRKRNTGKERKIGDIKEKIVEGGCFIHSSTITTFLWCRFGGTPHQNSDHSTFTQHIYVQHILYIDTVIIVVKRKGERSNLSNMLHLNG